MQPKDINKPRNSKFQRKDELAKTVISMSADLRVYQARVSVTMGSKPKSRLRLDVTWANERLHLGRRDESKAMVFWKACVSSLCSLAKGFNGAEDRWHVRVQECGVEAKC